MSNKLDSSQNFKRAIDLGVISRLEPNDLVKVWDASEGSERAVSVLTLLTGGVDVGVPSFITLTDTPSSYSGQGGKIVAVNSVANGLEFLTKAQYLGGTSSQFVKGDGSLDSNVYQNTSEKGQANGYAQLDSGAKIPTSIIPDSILGQVKYQGTWNATTNTPTLVNPPASTTKGDYYVVNTGGSFAGLTFDVGDWIISNGTAWEKVNNTDAVRTVFGRLGDVIANNGDYNTSQVTESGNLYFTEARVRSTPLTGYTVGSNTALSATDNILQAFEKVQGQINNRQPLSTNLTSLAGLTYASTSFVKMTASGTFALDTNTYLTGNQTITLSGDVTGSGTTAITTTLANSGVVAGTYNNVATQVRPFTVDSKGRITSIGTAITITPAFSSITNTPTTLGGYGITDAYTQTQVNNLLAGYLPLSGGTMTGDITATRIRGVNSLVLNTYTTVNPSSNVYLYSPPNDRDAWIYLDSADTGSNWGIYHRQIDSTVSGLPANSIGFIGGGSSTLQAWISLGNGNGFFAGNLTANSFIKSGGTSSQFLKADGSVDSTAYYPSSNPAGYTSNLGTVTSVTASSPLSSSGGTTPNITIQQASGSQGGFLSSTDWTTFNNKLSQSDGDARYLRLTGGTMTGVITTPNNTFGIIIGDDSRLADRNVANTLFLEGVQNNDRGYINFSQTTGNALGAINGQDLTWRGNAVWHTGNLTNPITGTGTRTENFVAKFGSGGNTVQNSQIFDNGTNLGINETNPSSKLQVVGQIVGGTSGFTSGMLGFTGLGSYNSSTNVENIDGLYLRKGGTNDSSVSIAFASAGGDSYFVGARIKHIRTGSNSNGHLAFETKSDSSTNTTAERMRITSGGNVLINKTNDEGFRLDVNGKGRFINGVQINTNQLVGHFQSAHTNNGSVNWNFGSIADGTNLTGMRINQIWNGSFNVESIDFLTHQGGVQAGVKMSITSGGDVGIGTMNPEAKLHTANLTLNNSAYQHVEYITANNSTEATGESYAGQASYGIGFRRQWTSSTFTNIAGIYAFGSAGWRGGLLFRTKNNTNSTGEPDVNALFLSPIGNVGIGTTNPNAKLSVDGTGPSLALGINIPNILISGASGFQSIGFRRDADTNGGWFIGTSHSVVGDFGIYQNQGASSPLNRISISTSGNVLIGTTSELTGGGRLQVSGTVNCDNPTDNRHAVTLGYLNSTFVSQSNKKYVHIQTTFKKRPITADWTQNNSYQLLKSIVIRNGNLEENSHINIKVAVNNNTNTNNKLGILRLTFIRDNNTSQQRFLEILGSGTNTMAGIFDITLYREPIFQDNTPDFQVIGNATVSMGLQSSTISSFYSGESPFTAPNNANNTFTLEIHYSSAITGSSNYGGDTAIIGEITYGAINNSISP